MQKKAQRAAIGGVAEACRRDLLPIVHGDHVTLAGTSISSAP